MDEEEVQEQVQEEPIDAPQDEQEQTIEQPHEEPVEQEEVEPAEPEEEEPEPYQVSPYEEVPQLDFSQLPADENGNIDTHALADAIQGQNKAVLAQAARMVQEVEERRTEERLWQKARDKYPELKSDKELAKEVNAFRFGVFANEVQDGKQARMMTPSQAFDRMNKRFSAYQAAGVKQATENVKVQESAYIEPTQNASKDPAESSKEKLFIQMRSYDKAEREAATDALLKNILFGK